MTQSLQQWIEPIKQLARQVRPGPKIAYTYADIYRLYFRADVKPVKMSKKLLENSSPQPIEQEATQADLNHKLTVHG